MIEFQVLIGTFCRDIGNNLFVLRRLGGCVGGCGTELVVLFKGEDSLLGGECGCQ